MRTASFIAAALLAIFDFQNLLAWWKGWTLKVGDQPSDDYTIIIPLFGHPRYFTARESLHPIRDRVMVVCETTPPIMADYADELETTGFGVLRVHDQHPSSATLVAAGVRQSASWYTLRLDADTIINPQIACAVQTFADSQADIGSFRIEARNPKTTAARIQAVEYRIAMLSRRYRPWMTSGALLIGKTTSLQQVFDHHSMWTPGEDIETGTSPTPTSPKPSARCDTNARSGGPETSAT
jgi:hypothetical protein